MERALGLKEEGNKLFRGKNWSKAAGKYTEALDVSIHLGDAKAKVLKGTLHSNRAECFLRMDPIACDKVIDDTDKALALMPGHIKTLQRRAKAYHAQGLSIKNPEKAMSTLAKAIKDLTSLLKKEPKHLPARQLLEKVRVAAKFVENNPENYQFYLNRLVKAANSSLKKEVDYCRDIRLVMQAFLARRQARGFVFQKGGEGQTFLSVLSRLATGELEGGGHTQLNLQIEAAKALSVVFSKDESNALETGERGDHVVSLVDSLLTRLKALRTTLSEKEIVAQKQPVVKLVAALLRLVCRALERKSCVGKARESAVNCLGEWVHIDRKLNVATQMRLLPVFFKGLSSLGSLEDDAGTVAAAAREILLKRVLFSEYVDEVRLRASIINTTLMLTGKKQQKNASSKSRNNEEKGRSHQPKLPKQYWEGADVKSMDFAKKWGMYISQQLSTGERSFKAVTKALIAILQANPPLGVFLITNGGILTEAKAAEKGDMKEQMKQMLQQAKAKKQQQQQGEETEKRPPPILSSLVVNAAHGSEENQRCALGVLALASQDKIIRTMVEKAGVAELFLDLIIAHDFSSQKDDIVLCHAIVAMAKQIAISENARNKALKNEDAKGLDDTSSIVYATKRMIIKAADARKNAGSSHKDGRGGDIDDGGDDEDDDGGVLSELKKDNARMMENLALEGLVFLSLVGEAKRQLLFPSDKAKNQAEFIEALMNLCSSKTNRAARFGGVQVLASLMRSSKDRERDYNKELAKLRQMASKGLGPDQSAQLAKAAGPPALAKRAANYLVKKGVISVLVCTASAYKHDSNGNGDEGEEDDLSMKEGKTQDATTSSRMKARSKSNTGMNEKMVEAMAFCFKKIAQDEANRGLLVQQKGLRLLSELYNLAADIMDKHGGPDSKKGMWREDCAVALARVAITTNPALYPTGSMYSMVRPLIWLFNDASHELHQFEAGLGLTNIASTDTQVRDYLVMNGAWSACINLLASENQQIQRVGIECMANLVVCEKSFERLKKSEQDIKLFLLFAKSDDLKCQMAASGGLAMMSQDPDIAKEVVRLGGKKVLEEIKANASTAAASSPDPSHQAVLARVNVALQYIQECA